MIRLEKYDALKHHSLIVYWLGLRCIDQAVADDLPKIGYIAYNRSLPIAAGFVRSCEDDLGMIEGLISNPMAKSEDRHDGLDDVIDACIQYAKARGVKRLLAYSIDVGTIKRSQSHGFGRLPHVLVGMNLGD